LQKEKLFFSQHKSEVFDKLPFHIGNLSYRQRNQSKFAASFVFDGKSVLGTKLE